jgi:hypothetical protein
MNHALAAPTPRTGLRVPQVPRGLPYAVYAVVIAAVLGCGMAIANMQSPSAAHAAQLTPADTTSSADSARAAEPRMRSRCAGCGVVESIRTLEATGKLRDQFEFTVRMRDGSTRVSRTTGRGQWRAGDRIILMAGVHASGA